MDIAIGVVEGKVVARWPEPVMEITFDPQNAYQVGVNLSKAALDAHRGSPSNDEGRDLLFLADQLTQQRIEVSDAQRVYLINKVSSILKSLEGRSNGYIAMHCVDAVLQETAR